jgi:glutamate 5-kinase
MRRILEAGNIIPIVNENDSVTVKELRVGDNDVLSARVAEFLGAKKLVLFTTVDGLLDKGDQLIETVHNVEEKMHMVQEGSGKFSIGGMASKLKAVKYANDAGIEVLVANGRKPRQLLDLVRGGGRGTTFRATRHTTEQPRPEVLPPNETDDLKR